MPDLESLRIKLEADASDFKDQTADSVSSLKRFFRSVEDGSNSLGKVRDANKEYLTSVRDLEEQANSTEHSSREFFDTLAAGGQEIGDVQDQMRTFGDEFERLTDLNRTGKISGFELIQSLKELRMEYGKEEDAITDAEGALKEIRRKQDEAAKSVDDHGRVTKDLTKATNDLATASERQKRNLRALRSEYNQGSKAITQYKNDVEDGTEQQEDAQNTFAQFPLLLKSIKTGLAGIGFFLVARKIKSMVTESVALVKTLREQGKTLQETADDLVDYNSNLTALDVKNIEQLGIAIEQLAKSSKSLGLDAASNLAAYAVGTAELDKVAREATEGQSLFRLGLEATERVLVGLVPAIGAPLALLKELGKEQIKIAGNEPVDPLTDKLKVEGVSTTKALRTAEKILADEQDRLNKLFRVGAIESETLIRGLTKAREAFRDNSGETKRNSDRLKEQAAAIKKVNAEARRLFESTRTPYEEWKEGQRDVNELFNMGKISVNTMRRAMSNLKTEYGEASGLAQKHRDRIAEAKKAMDALKDSATAVFQGTRNPLEKYNAELTKLGDLLDKNLISQDTFNRAQFQEQQKLADAMGLDEAKDKTEEISKNLRDVGNFGSGKLLLSGAVGGQGGSREDDQQKQTRILEDILQQLRRPVTARAV
jgi:methyl-accepting chemotaxis protein